MTNEILISTIGAFVAILVAIASAWLAHKNNLSFQNKKLKGEHYMEFVRALHLLASDNKNSAFMMGYTSTRDNMLLLASEDVISKLFEYEDSIKSHPEEHDEYLTKLFIAMRRDIGLSSKALPVIKLRK